MIFQLLDKFGMLTCWYVKHVHFTMRFVFLVNRGEQMMAFLVDNHRRVAGGGSSKN